MLAHLCISSGSSPGVVITIYLCSIPNSSLRYRIDGSSSAIRASLYGSRTKSEYCRDSWFRAA